MTDGSLDVDARFLLANERTLLAWVRTALTLVAVGVAGERFAGGVPASEVLGPLLVLLGAAAAVVGGRRHAQADAALRAGRLPATGRAPVALAAAVALAALGLLVALLVS